MAPETFGCASGKSYVHRQPSSSSAAHLAALAAMVACPTGSIRLSQGMREPAMAQIAASHFPAPIDEQRLPNVYHLGYHAPHSFGATPYLISAPSWVAMVDCPRFNSRLARRIEAEHGGIDYMLLVGALHPSATP